VSDWQRLSSRMLLVHPVHEVLRQLPVLVGSLVLGSATGNNAWPLAALGVTIGIGLLRWFFTTYRIDEEFVALRTGVLHRRSIALPRNRIRSVQTDSRLLHRLLGLTVLRVGTGHEARGRAAFALDAVEAAQVGRLRATLLGESAAPSAQLAGRVLARWRPSWLRYAPLSFSGLLMIGAAVGLAYQSGLGLTIGQRVAKAGTEAAHRTGVVVVVSVGVVGTVAVAVLLAVLWSWSTYGNLVLRLSSSSSSEGALHLRHGVLRVREHTFDTRRLRGGTLREPLLVRGRSGQWPAAQPRAGRGATAVDPGPGPAGVGRSRTGDDECSCRAACLGLLGLGHMGRGDGAVRAAGVRPSQIARPSGG
jgi:putative membrane protein